MIDVHKIINGFADLAKTKIVKQTGILYSSQILAMTLGFIITPIVTRTLGPERYGILTFILAIVAFISLFFEFGFFSAGARLLAVSKDKKSDQELTGAIILITAGIALSFFLIVFIFSFFIDSIFHTSAGNILRSISVLAAIIPFQYMLEQVCQGANEIKKLAIANVVPKLWYLVGLLIVISLSKLNVFIALALNLTGIVTAVGLVVFSLKPTVDNLGSNIKLVWKETKEYGFHVYFGRVVDVSTYQLDRIFISYFVNTVSVGFYSLAMLLTSPMALLSRAFSVSLFKDLSDEEEIPRKVIVFNLIWLLACIIGLGSLGRFIVVILFSNKYLPAVPLILPLALAGFFQGMYQPYNMFLAAHRKGKWLRKTSFIMGGANLVGNITLIPLWGTMGAAVASIIGTSLYFILSIFYYRKSVSTRVPNSRNYESKFWGKTIF